MSGLLEGGRVALSLLGEDVEQHRLVLRLEKLKSPDEQSDVVAVDGPVIAEAEFLEDHARKDEVLHARLPFCARARRLPLPPMHLDELRGLLVQMGVCRVRGDLVEVMGDGAHVFGDGPFVVVEDDDESLGEAGDIVERLVADAAGERRVARDGDDCSSEPALSRPTAMPSAAESAVPAWPAP